MHIERSSPREPSAQTKRRSTAHEAQTKRTPSADQPQTMCTRTADDAATLTLLKDCLGSLLGPLLFFLCLQQAILCYSFSTAGAAGPVRLAYRKKQPQGALSADQAQTKRRPGAEEAQTKRRPSADQAQINQRKCSQCFSDRNKQ